MRRSLLWATGLSILPTLPAQSTNSKRGLTYHDPGHRGEYDIFWSKNSTIAWYYNWGPWPSSSAPTSSNVQFLPLVHGISDIRQTISTIQQISSNHPQHNHLLTFNEPDGSISSGGSDISPADAAAAYIKYIVPLRSTYQISHPSTTGTGSGLNWLHEFNSSCYAIDPVNGCPTDFVAAHFYGDFPAMAGWLGSLHEFYPDKQIYVTEFALPQMDADTTLRMLNQSLPYLDQLDYISGYAWFGMFRTTEANNWTGPGVSLLDANGGLTELASLYLGGPERGYPVGAKSKGIASSANATLDVAARKELLGLVVAIAVAVSLWSSVT